MLHMYSMHIQCVFVCGSAGNHQQIQWITGGKMCVCEHVATLLCFLLFESVDGLKTKHKQTHRIAIPGAAS